MRSIFTLKPNRRVDPKAEKDNLEYIVEDVKGVERASFDPETMKVELEYDEEDLDFDNTDVIRAIQSN
ncbi:MAG: hypothetical protein Q8O99_06190 [bacterium]|nr:hypothetical protein [bacterium]